MLHSTKPTNFCKYIIVSLFAKWLRGPDEMASQAVVWRPLNYSRTSPPGACHPRHIDVFAIVAIKAI